MALPHQGLFTSKKFFEKYGLFDINCKYAMDYELLLRLYRSFPLVKINDLIVADWRAGGIGTNKTGEVVKEYHLIRVKNKIAPRWILNIIFKLTKIRYGIFT